MKKLNKNKIESITGGTSMWDCFTSVPRVLINSQPGVNPAGLTQAIVDVVWCWNN